MYIHYTDCDIDSIPYLVRNLRAEMTDFIILPNYTSCLGSSGYIVPPLVKNITTTEADILWTQTNTTMRITVNGQRYTSNGDSLHISGLTPNTPYFVTFSPLNTNDPCCAAHTVFYTNPIAHVGIPKATDFDSAYVRGYYGYVSNPFLNVGFVNLGPSITKSRHSIHTDTTEVDFVADNLLHTVCPGKSSSIRLGNWYPSAQAEALTYYLHIDTNLYSLIMLHYAVLLQNPNHNQLSQPRFRMEIVDGSGNVIDPQCGAADYYADSSLGWNTSTYCLWKDWTTVGINLSPYHGQDVCLRFITYDCAMGAHFGYAYFTFDCQTPYASSELCGYIDTNTLTAPEGFNYLWYHDSPTNPISTERSVTYATSDGNIHCRLSFIENPSCYITMDTYVSNFWPRAEIDTLRTINKGCDGYEVQFLNRSTIVDDSLMPFPNHPPCESAFWSFGDGTFSHEYSPVHVYHVTGPRTVTLISGLAGGQCLDTTQFTIMVPDAWIPVDEHLTTCDSLRWRDGLWYAADTTGPTHRIRILNKCDTIYTLYLSIVPNTTFTLPSDTVCYNADYTWRGQRVTANLLSNDTTVFFLVDTLTASNGCDSLDVLPVVQIPPDDLSIQWLADCTGKKYLLTAITDCPLIQWGSSPYDTSLVGHTSDRQLWVLPGRTTEYRLTSYRTFRGDSLFCPTTTTLSLHPVSFPTAQLEVNPDRITPDNLDIHAYDVSHNYPERHWAIINHGFGHDTIRLSDTKRSIVHRSSTDLDSVTVLLVVGNNGCVDTAMQTLPVIVASLFFPNVFAPDLGSNNRFFIPSQGILEAELTIYNRQGLFVYTTTDIEEGWDGTHNGVPCPQGAYVWHLRYITADLPGGWQVATGTVTLLR